MFTSFQWWDCFVIVQPQYDNGFLKCDHRKQTVVYEAGEGLEVLCLISQFYYEQILVFSVHLEDSNNKDDSPSRYYQWKLKTFISKIWATQQQKSRGLL